jgi:hypothetical protein
VVVRTAAGAAYVTVWAIGVGAAIGLRRRVDLAGNLHVSVILGALDG